MEAYMEIKIKGRTDCLSKNETKKLIEYLGIFFLGKKLSNYMYIEVQYKKMNNVYGLCDTIDFEEKNSREFLIFINKDMSRIRTIKTIIHEMVHVRQIARRHYEQYSKYEYKWMGKKIKMYEDDYELMPWEIEAVSYETPLYQECRELLKS
jgi:hypothetical protein